MDCIFYFQWNETVETAFAPTTHGLTYSWDQQTSKHTYRASMEFLYSRACATWCWKRQLPVVAHHARQVRNSRMRYELSAGHCINDRFARCQGQDLEWPGLPYLPYAQLHKCYGDLLQWKHHLYRQRSNTTIVQHNHAVQRSCVKYLQHPQFQALQSAVVGSVFAGYLWNWVSHAQEALSPMHANLPHAVVPNTNKFGLSMEKVPGANNARRLIATWLLVDQAIILTILFPFLVANLAHPLCSCVWYGSYFTYRMCAPWLLIKEKDSTAVTRTYKAQEIPGQVCMRPKPPIPGGLLLIDAISRCHTKVYDTILETVLYHSSWRYTMSKWRELQTFFSSFLTRSYASFSSLTTFICGEQATYWASVYHTNQEIT